MSSTLKSIDDSSGIGKSHGAGCEVEGICGLKTETKYLLKEFAMLVGVTNVVDSHQCLVTSEKGIDIGSTYRELYCVMCDEILGRVYQTTPRHLDNLRDVFTLDIPKIQSYQVGSGEQVGDFDTGDMLDMPSSRALQDDLFKIKATVCALNERLVNLEDALKCHEPEEIMDEEENQEIINEKEDEMNEADDEGECRLNHMERLLDKNNAGSANSSSDSASIVSDVYDRNKIGNKQPFPNDNQHRIKRKRTR
ncbi:uncharacterized protein LOC117105909 [Anneissia japonica]|uniref:uncharacterized protein LOC117105909 n=1 Tax=Anneissia japonica TaxID=1529436 RepID=UPI0014258B47|nr:uncharacterized protein LOC117105909 [Anneissia japonica]